MLNITKDSFEKKVISSEITVVLDFWATWCGPCKMQGALIDQKIVPDHPEIEVLKVNVDEETGLAGKFGSRAMPTRIV